MSIYVFIHMYIGMYNSVKCNCCNVYNVCICTYTYDDVNIQNGNCIFQFILYS